MFSRNNYETNAYLECLDIIKSFFILKGPPAPTWQIPICLTPVSLLVLLVPDVELEGTCAFAIVTDTDNESKLSPITTNKNYNTRILCCLRLSSSRAISYADSIARFPPIICYMRFVSNKLFNVFIAKFHTFLSAIMLVIVDHIVIFYYIP